MRTVRAHQAAITGELSGSLMRDTLALALGYTSRRQPLLSRAKRRSLMLERERQIRELNAWLEQRVAERPAPEAVNAELEAFTGSVSHDLRAPLRQVGGFARLLEETAAKKLDARERTHLAMLRNIAAEAAQMVEDLLSFSRMSRTELRSWTVDLNALVRSARDGLQHELAGRRVEWTVHPLPGQGIPAFYSGGAEPPENALKYSRRKDPAHRGRHHSSPSGYDIVWCGTTAWGSHEARLRSRRLPAAPRGPRLRGHRHRAGPRGAMQRHGGRVWPPPTGPGSDVLSPCRGWRVRAIAAQVGAPPKTRRKQKPISRCAAARRAVSLPRSAEHPDDGQAHEEREARAASRTTARSPTLPGSGSWQDDEVHGQPDPRTVRSPITSAPAGGVTCARSAGQRAAPPEHRRPSVGHHEEGRAPAPRWRPRTMPGRGCRGDRLQDPLGLTCR
jgi:hypothetical protein